MSRRRKILRGLGIGLGLVVLLLVGFAPSWRSYYLPRKSVRIIEDQVYVSGSANPKHMLDLYLPTTSAGPWPVVVFVHGGYWRPQDRRIGQFFTGLHGGVGVALANQGVATAVISYRQFPEAATIPDALEDVARAVRYVIDNIGKNGGDPKRVYVVGHSAGAMMTSLLALSPQYLEQAGVAKGQVRGFACLAGPYDLPGLRAGLDAGNADKVLRSAKDEAGLDRFSAQKLVRPDHPPMLLLVGTRELPVLLEQHQRMSAALRSAGGDVSTAEVQGADHMDLVMHLSRKDDRALSELLGFIARHP